MKIKRIPIFVLVLCLGGNAFADMTDDVTAVFGDFLGRLTAKHKALESLSMPGMEIRGEFVTQAAVTLTFENSAEAKVFIKALEAENIPYVSFPEEEKKVLLISVDMMIFVMQEAIGL
jgi:Ser/Thr protein kinase RdoA (MazF antagonist)